MNMPVLLWSECASSSGEKTCMGIKCVLRCFVIGSFDERNQHNAQV